MNLSQRETSLSRRRRVLVSIMSESETLTRRSRRKRETLSSCGECGSNTETLIPVRKDFTTLSIVVRMLLYVLLLKNLCTPGTSEANEALNYGE